MLQEANSQLDKAELNLHPVLSYVSKGLETSVNWKIKELHLSARRNKLGEISNLQVASRTQNNRTMGEEIPDRNSPLDQDMCKACEQFVMVRCTACKGTETQNFFVLAPSSEAPKLKLFLFLYCLIIFLRIRHLRLCCQKPCAKNFKKKKKK